MIKKILFFTILFRVTFPDVYDGGEAQAERFQNFWYTSLVNYPNEVNCNDKFFTFTGLWARADGTIFYGCGKFYNPPHHDEIYDTATAYITTAFETEIKPPQDYHGG